jgi:hypothetical protein
VEQRVPASERTRQRIEALLKDGTSGDLQAELIRLGVRRLVEEALEAEASEALGRGYYERDSEQPVTATVIAADECARPRARLSTRHRK